MWKWIFGLFLLLIGCETAAVVTPTATPKPTATATPLVGVTFATLAPPTRAVVQLTPSPLPTATATPTATPIVYAVQGGDTLWSIALLNRTLPQTIEALNPDLRPASLQIGQEIVLPPQPTALAASAAGTPIPVSIAVKSLRFYPTPLGGGWILGEIENEGVFSAENIRLQISLLDADKRSLGELSTWAAAPVLPPSRKAPFAVYVPHIGIEPATLSATVIGGNTVTNLGTRYLGLVVDEAEMHVSDTQITVDTTIRNSGELTPTSAIVITTLYDASGGVSGMVVRDVGHSLGMGDAIPFSAEIIPLGPTTRDFALFVYGRLPRKQVE